MRFERKQLIEDWDDMSYKNPILSKYSTNVAVDYDTDYVVRVH